ncbi:MAG: SDR family oxidoreductase [Geminicoccaceae bacterium]|nr:SDR family oxidoreductase [Geminicoccaceae bacterium]
MSEDIVPQAQDRQPGTEGRMQPRPEFMPRFPGSGRLAGKVALITGGDSGIGRACAVLFAREGADVAITWLDESEDAEETQRAVEGEGRRCLSIAGDLADGDFCADVVRRTVETLGRLDVLVNNAAEQHPQERLEDLTRHQLERTFATNFFGLVAMTRAALPHLRQGSAIVNTTSITAYRGSWHLMDYASTKGAIVSFTRSLATNLVDRGIRVNAVAAGPIWTPLIPASFDPERVAKHGENAPMGRPGQPNEVAPCHLFLACDDSSYMTGQVLHPNGGTVVGG